MFIQINQLFLSDFHLREIEIGQKQPGIDVLAKICSGLDITLADFFAQPDQEISLKLKRLTTAASKLKPEQLEALINFLEQLDDKN